MIISKRFILCDVEITMTYLTTIQLPNINIFSPRASWLYPYSRLLYIQQSNTPLFSSWYLHQNNFDWYIRKEVSLYTNAYYPFFWCHISTVKVNAHLRLPEEWRTWIGPNHSPHLCSSPGPLAGEFWDEKWSDGLWSHVALSISVIKGDVGGSGISRGDLNPQLDEVLEGVHHCENEHRVLDVGLHCDEDLLQETKVLADKCFYLFYLDIIGNNSILANVINIIIIISSSIFIIIIIPSLNHFEDNFPFCITITRHTIHHVYPTPETCHYHSSLPHVTAVTTIINAITIIISPVIISSLMHLASTFIKPIMCVIHWSSSLSLLFNLSLAFIFCFIKILSWEIILCYQR